MKNNRELIFGLIAAVGLQAALMIGFGEVGAQVAKEHNLPIWEGVVAGEALLVLGQGIILGLYNQVVAKGITDDTIGSSNLD